MKSTLIELPNELSGIRMTTENNTTDEEEVIFVVG
jgi:hypothetical protein